MKILYYDCFAGISGDMNLSALVDLGVDKNYIIQELKKLPVSGYSLDFYQDMRKGITGKKLHIDIFEKNNKHIHYSNIVEIINTSKLNEKVKELSIKIFYEIALAESKVHNIPIEKVHFHEVGALDSIIDIVGCAIAIDYLKPDKIFSSPVELGSGMVECQHGILPVPAPATIEILKNVPVTTGRVNYEATTPTGAAILKVLANEFKNKLSFNPIKIGYGIGTIDAEIPNVLRIILGEIEETSAINSEKSIFIECNIDDMNPEYYEYIISKLFEAGAQDVFIQPVIMKKSRPAYILSILVDLVHEKNVLDIVFKETTTLGCRRIETEKLFLPREIIEVDTPFGKIRVKKSFYGENFIKIKPEYEDCINIARKHNIPLIKVYEIIQDYLKQLKDE